MTLLAASFIFATAATLVAWARACRQRVAAEDRARKLDAALKFADARINHERETVDALSRQVALGIAAQADAERDRHAAETARFAAEARAGIPSGGVA